MIKMCGSGDGMLCENAIYNLLKKESSIIIYLMTCAASISSENRILVLLVPCCVEIHKVSLNESTTQALLSNSFVKRMLILYHDGEHFSYSDTVCYILHLDFEQ